MMTGGRRSASAISINRRRTMISSWTSRPRARRNRLRGSVTGRSCALVLPIMLTSAYRACSRPWERKSDGALMRGSIGAVSVGLDKMEERVGPFSVGRRVGGEVR